MKTVLLALATTTALSSVAFAQDAITEFNIGILGGENAQDRMTSNECFRAAVEGALGVPVKLFTPADYDGVIQGLLGGTLDYAGLGASCLMARRTNCPPASRARFMAQTPALTKRRHPPPFPPIQPQM